MDKVVRVSLPTAFVKKLDEIAKQESRTRSELIREAARMYVERKQRWANIFALGDEVRKRHCITPSVVAHQIARHRKKR